MITFAIEVTGREELKAGLLTFFNQEVPPVIAPVVKREIIQDAAKSKGPDGELWPLYTPQYEARKKKITGGYGVKPNLWVTGDMLTSIHLDSEKVLRVSDEEMPKAKGNSARRRFMGVSPLARLNALVAIIKLWNDKSRGR